ncbi:MAG: AAA family ATPase [Bacilli bacterium]|nr:AAA family ATPase [Bacilli bacterium]
MAKKYVATIMTRLYLGDDKFLFFVSHPEIGSFDEKTEIFTDRNGTEYISMVDPVLMMSEVNTAYGNMVDLEELPDLMDKESLRSAISNYNTYCSRFIYYVSKTPKNGLFCIPIDLVQLRNNMTKAMDQIEQQLSSSDPDEVVSREDLTSIAKDIVDNNEEDKELEDVLHSKEIRSDIAALLMDIMDGVYSLDEIKEIRDVVEFQLGDLEGLLDSLDLQIEASEKGESSNILKGEKPRTKKTLVEQSSIKPRVPKIDHYIDLDDLYKKVTSTLIAQDEPTRRVITEIARKEQDPASKSRGLLITGQTGSGKTKMMQLIAKYLDRPFFKIDSTQLTIPGYVGKDIEEALWDLYVACGKDKDKTESAIVFFDEIDKKGSSRKDDVSGKGVLNVLLPFIEGSTYDVVENVKMKSSPVKINTSNMIVILGGAFTDVYNQLKESNSIGFAGSINNNKTRNATTQDFIEKAKMPDEFMGRVSIIKLNDLDVEALKRIILESDESAIEIQKKLFKKLGVKLTLADDFVDALANRAIKKNTGARGLNTAVEESTWEAYGDAYSHLGKYSEIILGAETIEDPKQYKKVMK